MKSKELKYINIYFFKNMVSFAVFPVHFVIWFLYARHYGVRFQDLFLLRGRSGFRFSRCFLSIYRKGPAKQDLVTICRVASRAKNHVVFEKLCEEYEGGKFFYKPLSSVLFFGEGNGEGALKTYRVVRDFYNTFMFEKIFFTGSKCEKKAIFFEDYLQDSLSLTRIKFPNIIDRKVCKNLSVFYYDFLNDLHCAHDLPSREKKALLLFFLKELLEFGKRHGGDFSDKIRGFSDISEEQVVKEGLGYYCATVSRNSINLDSVNNLLNVVVNSDEFLIFSHGDLSVNNFNSERVLWDWDRVGFYPVGFDLAWGVVTSFDELFTIRQMYDLAVSIAIDVYSEDFSKSVLERNVLAFFIICFFRKNKISEKLNSDVIDFLKCHEESLLKCSEEAI